LCVGGREGGRGRAGRGKERRAVKKKKTERLGNRFGSPQTYKYGKTWSN
jgi:hypothetical protein